jgi:Periplasmic copper-binding protein (NosD)
MMKEKLKVIKKIPLALWFAGFLLFGSGQALAGPQFVVDDDRQQCKNATFMRIQDAVIAAPPGADIKVCPGTYVEQVTIPVGKNGITLRSERPLAAIIQYPGMALADQTKSIVHVDGARDVTIRGFKITGPGLGVCDSIRFGVLVDRNGSAMIRDNYVTEIRDAPFGGCQNGTGIQVGRFLSDTSEISPGTATVFKNTIDRYQKNGITVNEVGSIAEVAHNEITGAGPTGVIAQNGIQVAYGASAKVHHNEVSENIYSPGTFSATGILLFDDSSVAPTGNVVVEHNKIMRNDEGILSESTQGVKIRYNRTVANSYDGIGLVDTQGANVSHNHSSANNLDGIYVSTDSTGNSITNNWLIDNGEHDAHDDSTGTGSCGTANYWDNNHCETDNRGGCLCGNNPNAGDGNSAALQSAAAFSRVGVASNRASSPKR